jgi:hypothetical protein
MTDCRRSRELQRMNEMADRERRTQELLKSCEAGVANKKKAIRSTWGITAQKVMNENMSHDRVRQYSDAFERIQAATGAWVEV